MKDELIEAGKDLVIEIGGISASILATVYLNGKFNCAMDKMDSKYNKKKGIKLPFIKKSSTKKK